MAHPARCTAFYLAQPPPAGQYRAVCRGTEGLVARLLIRWSGIIVLLLALAVGAIRAQPYHDAELKNLLKGACARPCWQQIYPGATTGEEALAIMKRFNLARDVGIHFDRRTGQIFWRWSADTA